MQEGKEAQELLDRIHRAIAEGKIIVHRNPLNPPAIESRPKQKEEAPGA
jgi:hypothetical protein